MSSLSLDQLHEIRRGQFGVVDAPCPVCGPDRRSPINRTRKVLRLWCDTNGFISYRCARCAIGGYAHDGRDRKHSVLTANRTFSHATERIHAGQSAPHRKAGQQPGGRVADEARRSEFALQLWSGAVSARNTLAEKYLASRRLALPDGHEDVLRFHPSCQFGKGTRHPCLVALFRDIRTNEPRAVHRTALTAGGQKLDRKSLGPIGGCAIKISPDEHVDQGLTVGEGVETVLAGMALNFRPAWALGSARAIAGFPVLSGIECLTILVDHDESGAGQESALECSRRWTSMGREIFRVVPTSTGTDIADVVCGRAA